MAAKVFFTGKREKTWQIFQSMVAKLSKKGGYNLLFGRTSGYLIV